MKGKLGSGLMALGLLASLMGILLVGFAEPTDGPREASREEWPIPAVASESGDGEGGPDGKTAAEPAPEGTVLLTVRSTADGRPIAGATVSHMLWYWEYHRIGVTGDDGSIPVSPPESGAFRVAARCEGYVGAVRSLDPADRTGTLLLEPGVPVTGRVVDAADDSPVAGAVVIVLGDAPNHVIDGPLRTDAKGRFLIAGVPRGRRFGVEVRKPGFAIAWREDRREEDDHVLVVRLGAGARVTGRVRSADGKPVAGAEVFFRSEGVDPRYSSQYVNESEMPGLGRLGRTITDRDGRYEMRGLPVPSTWLLAARTGRNWGAPIRVFVTNRDAREKRDFVLRPRASIRVRLTGPGGAPIREGRVRCREKLVMFGLGVPTGKRMAHAPEADGTWHLLPQGEGPYELRADAPGFIPVERRVEAAPGTEVEVTLALARGITLEGIVLDPEEKPVEGARVRFGIRPREGVLDQWVNATTGSDGTFRLEGLQDAAGELSAGCVGRPRSRQEARPGSKPVTIHLEAAASIHGRFHPPPDVDTVRVSLRRSGSGGWSGDRRVAPDGSFVLHPWFNPYSRGEQLHLTLTLRGRAPVEFRDLQVRPGAKVDLGEIATDAGVTLHGIVRDHGGTPVSGARIELSMKILHRPRYACTDPQGKFRFERVARAPGQLTVMSDTVHARGSFAEKKIPDTETAGEVEIALPPLGVAALTVVGPEGMPVSGLSVALFPVSGKGESIHCLRPTDSGGRLRLELPPGRYYLRYEDGPKAGEEPVVEVKAGREENIRVTTPFRGPAGWKFLPR